MNPKEEKGKTSGPYMEPEENEADALEQSQNFIRKNKNLLIIAGLVVIAAVALFWYLSYKNSEETKKASIELSKILPVYNSGDYKSALTGTNAGGLKATGLKAIANKYENTTPGQQAALYAGNALLNTNRSKESKKYFQMALEAKPDLVLVGANAGLGAALELENNFKEAAERYMKASDIAQEDFVKQKYKYFGALCYENAGNKEKAIELYRDLVNEAEFSEFGSLSKSNLMRLGIIIE